MSRTSRARKLSAATQLTHQQAVQHLEHLDVPVHSETEYVQHVEALVSAGAGLQLKACRCGRRFYELPRPSRTTCPRCVRHESDDLLWDADAKAAVRTALARAKWDLDDKVVRLPDVDVRGDATSVAVASLGELLVHLRETAFAGYNQTAPRDDGDWVFPMPDDDLVNRELEAYESQLTQLGWW